MKKYFTAMVFLLIIAGCGQSSTTVDTPVEDDSLKTYRITLNYSYHYNAYGGIVDDLPPEIYTFYSCIRPAGDSGQYIHEIIESGIPFPESARFYVTARYETIRCYGDSGNYSEIHEM